ncbi:MAG: hypothetical protein H6849_00855 [Alphaproteobacteria bacterium]|nr:MAG: hypothetical protein H6849_00855 [Alphaproteobacteria bacterium]
MAQVLSTLGAGVGGNPAVASRMSANALDNNFVFTALALAGTAMTLYEIAEAGYREGATGAARVAGQAAAFALVGGVAVKGVVKIGGKLYAAVGPRMIELSRPMLQRVMAGDLGETIGRTMVRVGHPRGEFLGNVHTQGMSFEDYVGRMFRSQDRLPPNFKTFDFFHRPTGSAISVKTMDTLTAAKLANPRQVYYSLKRNIDAVRGFTHYRLKSPDSGVRRVLSARDVSNRVVYLGIPKLTRSEQIAQIQRAMRYGREQGVQLRVFKLE